MRNFLFHILLFLTTISLAQEVSFKAQPSRTSLGENEHLRVDFTMNKEGDNFVPPSFENFEVTGPTQSISHSWINGNRSFSKTYTYMLQPKRKGKLTIGVASIIIDGKEYKTKPIAIEVTDPVSNPRNTQTNPPPSNPFGGFPFGFDPFGSEDEQPTQVIEPTKDELFIVAEVSEKQVYVNQPIAITYKLYIDARFGIAGLENIQEPRYANFWSQQLLDKIQVTEVMHNGHPFRCVTLKQVLLYPQQAGEQVISPLSSTFVLQLPSNQVDFFGNRSYVTRTRNLQTATTKINVLPLPEEGKPANFSGAVGNFSLSMNFPTRSLNAGETTVGEVVISGKGNFKLFDIPKLSFPPALEVYAPKEKENLTNSTTGISGDIVHSYTIVPQYKGKFPIPPLSFTFFNPDTQKYETLTSENITIEVLNGQEYKPIHEQEQGATTHEQGQFQPLKEASELLPLDKTMFFASTAFYLLWLLPLLLIPLVLVGWYIYQKRNDDTQENRSRRTSRLAKKYLSAAKKNLTNKEAFYEALERGLHTYLKAKLYIETSELSKDKIQQLLTDKGVAAEPLRDFIQLLSNCEMARYAPYTQTDINNDYQQAATIIALLDKQL
ncbi:BatD family protein [uncultured Capnocytophaga sp.]|uniref:BatD family protein n=1 Tax=uncultured Capnocytophaga sp. TaxID=159273 RepID=UPI0026128C32|nr:BatD family protein [uncultured Capnocytophaga sp.]